MSPSPVTDFYNNKNIFITGVTGFLGKAVVEKLLRSCNVGTIYLLMRPKRGKDVRSRLEDLKKNPVFETLKKQKDDTVFNKLVAVAGDVGEENLGLSEKDRETLINNVDIVFHSAATLDFDQNIKIVVNINYVGTQRIIQLSSQMKRLQSLVYVSTAYANSNRTHADEILYPKPGSEDELTELLKMSDADAEAATKRVIKDHPNSYTISKAFAEYEIKDFHKKTPSAIVRPSMIIGAWAEPIPGWTESKNGFPGFVMGAAMGVVRRLPVNKNLIYDYIPVDAVVNEVILAGWHVAANRPSDVAIFHCTSSTSKPFSWIQVEDKIGRLLNAYPLKAAVWYPTLKLLPNFTLFRISTLFFHFLPGLFFDTLLKLSGEKPRLLRLHYKVDNSLCRLAPFIFKEWFFDNSNTQKLFMSLTKDDKQTFNIDLTNVSYENLFENGILGVRKYLNKEELTTLPAARKKNRILYVLNIAVQVFVFAMVWWTTATVCNLDLITAAWSLPVFYLVFNIL